MSERDLRGTWKIKERKVAKTFSPIIGVVYEGRNKFFGGTVVGILIQMFEENDEAVIQTKGNKLVCVDLKSLKAITV